MALAARAVDHVSPDKPPWTLEPIFSSVKWTQGPEHVGGTNPIGQGHCGPTGAPASAITPLGSQPRHQSPRPLTSLLAERGSGPGRPPHPKNAGLAEPAVTPRLLPLLPPAPVAAPPAAGRDPGPGERFPSRSSLPV